MIQLKDICDIYDCPHTTAKDEGKGYPLVRTPNVGKGRLILDGIHRVSEDVYNSRNARAIPEEGDLILAREAPVGNVSIIMDGQRVCLGQRVVLIKPKRELVDPHFLTYYLLSAEVQHRLKNHANGAVVAHLNVSDIRNLWVTLPELEEQVAIGKILRSIDDKIELNRQINDNLELQAQALYKSWFVDFEPFCEEEFIETSLGSIPAGWKVGQLSDICEIVGGGTPSKIHPEYYCSRGIAWITPKDLSVSKSKFSSRGSEDITSDGYKNSSAKLMPRGTVLFSSRAPIGYISIATNEICTNQGFKSAVPGIAGTGYLYYFLQANTDKIESKASGSTFKEASGSLMKTLEVIIPADGILKQFEAELAPILNKQESIAREIQTLTTLRDTLLPKLMSGELRINEIDC